MSMNEREKIIQIYDAALEEWGEAAQVGMFIEEIGEVLTALNKRHRNTNNCSHVDFIEELVDLEIMLEQMKLLYAGNEWIKIKKEKLKRLAKKLGMDYD